MSKDLEKDGYVYPGQRLAKNGTNLGHGQGMTLRDYFAGQALAGMIATAAAPCLLGVNRIEGDIAKAAYVIADAMISARANSPQEFSKRDFGWRDKTGYTDADISRIVVYDFPTPPQATEETIS